MDNDTIYRQDALDALDGEFNITGRENAETIRDYINGVSKKLRELPSAERRGRWIMNGCIEQCNLCGEPRRFPHWTTCPNCGAQMEAKE